MKIGIISMQRVPNYGSFLQAYCMKGILNKLGHDVVFVDYKEGNPIVPYNRKALIRYKFFNIPTVTKLNDIFKYYVLGKKEFVYKYRMFYLKELGVLYNKNYNTNLDCILIGSDEVFNCLQRGFNVGFSPMLFGVGVKTKKIISYAASFGNTDIAGLRSYGLDSILAGYLNNFSDLSVRDLNSYNNIKCLTKKDASINIDPVLLYDIQLPDVKSLGVSYVVLYTYKSRSYSDEDKHQIIEFCRRNGKKLVSIGNSQNWVDIQISASPREMLSYIKKADFIITDTFHGTVFSIKLNKKFATFVREDNSLKLMDLLIRLEKTERRITSFSELQFIYESEINYVVTNEIILKEKERAFNYLKDALR